MHLREKGNGQENEIRKYEPGRWQGRRARRFEDSLLAFVSDRGPCAPVREGERSAEKEVKTNQKKKEKGQRPRAWGVERHIPEQDAGQRRVASQNQAGRGHIPERGEGGGGVVLQRKAKNEGHRGRRDAWQRDEQEGEKKGSGQRTKKKRKKIKKTHQVAAASHLAFMSGKAQKGDPPAVVNERGS